jgi:hypothetical protein
MPFIQAATALEWRCACGALLGKLVGGGELEIRYKDAAYRARGSVRTNCRRCQAKASCNTIHAVEPASAAAPPPPTRLPGGGQQTG